MKAVIIAGGRGTRMGKLTDDVPKSMLMIGNKPIIGHQIISLNQNSILDDDIIICMGYKHHTIEDWLIDSKLWGIINMSISQCDCKNNHTWKPLGTGGPLKVIEKMIDGTFFVVYGDIYFDMNLTKLLEFHRKNKALITVVLHASTHLHDSDLIKVENDRIVEFIGKPKKGEEFPTNITKSSIFVMEPEVFKYLPEGKFNFEDILPELIKTGRVYGYLTDEYIKDIGTPERLQEVNDYVMIPILERIAKQTKNEVVNLTKSMLHARSALSIVNILVALYYYKKKEEDRFILSKGHGCASLYHVLANLGIIQRPLLKELEKYGGLPSHPTLDVPGIYCGSGSLAQGFSIGCGVALAQKEKVYVIIGDGECNEGQIWESAMFASNYKLNNLIVFLDRNQEQRDGKTEEIMKLEPLADKWRSFGWNVICIGNNFKQIVSSIELSKKSDKPNIIIVNTEIE